MGLMTGASVCSLRAAPTMATFGLSSVFLYVVAAIAFLLPTAFVSAELASGWNGGIYRWVSEGISPRFGFMAVWCQFGFIFFYFPMMLGYVASTFAYVIDPNLASSGLFTAIAVLIAFWGCVIATCRGIRVVSGTASWGLIIGTLIPAVVLIVLGVIFLAQGNPSAAPMTTGHILPAWTGMSSLVLIVGTFTAYSGMEMNAVHVNEMAKPAREFPRAIVLATIIVLFVFIPPALVISWVVPGKTLSLSAGVMQAFSTFFSHFGISGFTPVLGIMILVAMIGGTLTWISGPAKGLMLIARQEGYLPRGFQKVNKAGVPQNMLVVQGLIISAISVAYAFISSVSAAYWILLAVCGAIYLVMYLLMFVAAARLRRTQPDHRRGYRAPALKTVCVVGFVATLIGLYFCFVPPSQQAYRLSSAAYVTISVAATIIVGVLVPLALHRWRRPSWKMSAEELTHMDELALGHTAESVQQESVQPEEITS